MKRGLLRRIACDARQIQAVARALVIGQVAAEMRTARREDKARRKINSKPFIQNFGLPKRGPAVLSGICLEVVQSAVARNREQRLTAHGIVEDRLSLGIQLVKQCHVGLIKRMLRLRICEVLAVTAHCSR